MKKRQLVFATHNKHKVEEVKSILGNAYEVLSLTDIDCHEDIVEDGDSFEANAAIKAKYVFDKYGLSCFAEDSGLVVPSLNGEPGIYSARYAGKHGDHEANIDKLLSNLENKEDRKAYFQSTIALISEKEVQIFEGQCHGTISESRLGSGGFGYDPVFVPVGYDNSFGELGSAIKNEISHRGKSMEKFIEFLKSN